jgi:uncharacterized protein YndB with AHSA1/START domain
MPTTPHVSDYGTVEQIDGRYVLRFERRFAHPVERVWDALTQPDRIREWFGDTEIDLELVAGGRYDTRVVGPPELIDAIRAEHGDEVDLATRQKVLRVDRPRLFEHTFGGPEDSVVRWELERDGDGTRLLLTHMEPVEFAPADSPRDLAGWHVLLEAMERALAGAPESWKRERWEQVRDEYAARATPGE